jgi:hypothetical protein
MELEGASNGLCPRRRAAFGCGILIDSRCCYFDFIAGEQPMSAPSRRPEIRRRRARQHKITTLRKRLASAKTDSDRDRVTAKLHKLAIASPGQPLLK